MSDRSVIDAIREEATVLHGMEDVSAVTGLVGDAHVVLLGEATHGTHEFYSARMEITKRLLTEKGFDAVAVECDWPDALRVNRFIQGRNNENGVPDPSAEISLANYQRFPRWMWRNEDVVQLIRWLREFNDGIPALENKAGFFGIDLYSLRSSMNAVVQYLLKVDPEAAKRARARYACFDQLAEDPQRYGYAATFGMKKDCEDEVVQQLVGLTANLERYARADGVASSDDAFYAAQNARVAQNAEAYYRAMFQGRNESWNLRDTHMADTLDALCEFLGKRKGRPAKIVVWAHNSHLGDARFTEMGEHGQINLGQLSRERYGTDDTFLLGFTTHSGTVTAASDWDSPAELKRVRPGRNDSFEHLLHSTGLENFLLPIRGREKLIDRLQGHRLERAIGVVYLPESERLSHYFYSDLVNQFDAVIHFDKTEAVRPLDPSANIETAEEVPETYPSGI
jgi:erythromycin esterase-like protein